jgi:hypothetical protein
MINLKSYSSIESTLLVAWSVPNLGTAYVTDYTSKITNNGHTYTNIGNLLGVSNVTSELTTTPGEITVSLAGIPTASVPQILAQDIKGSAIEISRAFFNPTTHQPLILQNSTNTFARFVGIVTNYTITDSVNTGAKIAVSTITLTCASNVEMLSKLNSGRRTNPEDFPGESSMSRVRALANSNFNFGAP